MRKPTSPMPNVNIEVSEGRGLPGWAPIPECGGYEASDTGLIANPKGKILRQWKQGGTLRVEIRGRNRMVHYLIAAAFHGVPTFHGFRVRHRNSQWDDNRAENLFYAGSPTTPISCLCGHPRWLHVTHCYDEYCPCNQWRELLAYRKSRGTLDD